MKVAVAGATGRVGRPTVEVLLERGHDVVRMSRSTGVDLITGRGLAEALTGVECVIDAATWPSPDESEATAFFTTAAENLQRAGAAAGVRRIVVMSIIGIDHFNGGYSAAKQVHERTMLAGPVPARIVRAAQFHEFVDQMVDWATQGDIAYLPHIRTQAVAARAVAEVLADVALDADGQGVVEVAGPREEDLVSLATLLAGRRGRPLKVEAVSNPDELDHRLYESGALLPGPHAILTGPTFEEWLDANG